MHNKRISQKGFAPLLVVLIIVVVAAIGFFGYKQITSHNERAKTTPGTTAPKFTGGTKDVSYGSDPQQKLDVYSADSGDAKPIVIAIHGGGWHAGDKAQFSDESTEIASAGYAVFNINYRLSSPKLAGFPMQNEDVQSAVAWVKEHAASYKADDSNITLLGGSAGAHLSLLNGELINTKAPGTIKKVISLSAPTDFVALANIGSGDILAEKASNASSGPSTYLGCPATECPESTLKAASPLYNIDKNCPKVLLFNSTNELVPLPQAQSMQDALVAAGCQSTLKVFDGTQHAFKYFQTAKAQILQFLISS